jgi:iron complex transport system ATP-binding protein
MTDNDSNRLSADRLSLGYDATPVVADLSVDIVDGTVTAIVGPNACGKSTLLRGLARLMKPVAGQVILDGHDITALHTKKVARRLGLMPQTSIAPDGITVSDLVSRGRFPHQRVFRQWSTDDEQAVTAALAAAGVTDLAGRQVDELSGGQRQRIWVAMLLAQETPVILLDEPTTFLDIAHQIELLELLVSLSRDNGRTVVAVLHDLNHACRFADQIVAMKAGRVIAKGAPAEVITPELMEEVYGIACQIIADPQTGTPLVIPRASTRVRDAPQA